MYRRTRNRKSETEAGKSSFFASPHSLRQDRSAVQSAIDESLSAVHFSAQDMRTVLKSTRGPKKKANTKRRRRSFRPDLAFTFALVMMFALPLSLYAIKSRESIKTIVAGPADITPQPAATAALNADLVSPMPTAAPEATSYIPADAAISESEAIRIARECFAAQCDTSIFTFEEYEVHITLNDDANQYTVEMESIYKNGCSFTVILSADSGEILQYSSPKLATVPALIDISSPEVLAWYDKYGEHLFTWPQDVQAEFSRRYQGATLRAAKESEISCEAAVAAVSAPIEAQVPGRFSAFYPVLYSERAAADGRAYYVVYCYAQAVTDELPKDEPMTVSFDAETGDIISIEGNPLELSLSSDAFMKSK